jgi:hypothetical protein
MHKSLLKRPLPAQERWPAHPAALHLARRDRTLPDVADRLRGPALPVLLAATAAQQARHADVVVGRCGACRLCRSAHHDP